MQIHVTPVELEESLGAELIEAFGGKTITTHIPSPHTSAASRKFATTDELTTFVKTWLTHNMPAHEPRYERYEMDESQLMIRIVPIPTEGSALLKRCGSSTPHKSVKEAVSSRLDGEDCERGELEGMSASISNLRTAFSALMNLAVEKGVLTEDEIASVILDDVY